MIKRYFATKDNTITNAFAENLITKGTGSNMGASDILEVFSIYGQVSSSSGYSSEESRILIEFDVAQIQQDIDNGLVDANASFYLRLFNAEHGRTLPMDFDLEVKPLATEWEEGTGLDMEDYRDLTYGHGSSWAESGGGNLWNTEGGDFTADTPVSQTFDEGWEDLVINVTSLVSNWLGSVPVNQNYGLAITLPSSLSSLTRSYYTKMFFARSSSHFFKRPVLEARWNSQKKDQRAAFYASSPLSPSNINTIYFYNIFRGAFVDIPNEGIITVDLYEELGGTALGSFEASKEALGTYAADVEADTLLSTIYDVWSNDGVQIHTGSIDVLTHDALPQPELDSLVISCLNKSKTHSNTQTSRFHFYIRERDWSPNIYVVASSRPAPKVYDNLIYKITRVVTDEVIVDYDTEDLSTILSYDSNGNYFDLDISMLEANYVYEIHLALFSVATNSYQELPFKHKFRVVDNEY